MAGQLLDHVAGYVLQKMADLMRKASKKRHGELTASVFPIALWVQTAIAQGLRCVKITVGRIAAIPIQVDMMRLGTVKICCLKKSSLKEISSYHDYA